VRDRLLARFNLANAFASVPAAVTHTPVLAAVSTEYIYEILSRLTGGGGNGLDPKQSSIQNTSSLVLRTSYAVARTLAANIRRGLQRHVWSVRRHQDHQRFPLPAHLVPPMLPIVAAGPSGVFPHRGTRSDHDPHSDGLGQIREKIYQIQSSLPSSTDSVSRLDSPMRYPDSEVFDSYPRDLPPTVASELHDYPQLSRADASAQSMFGERMSDWLICATRSNTAAVLMSSKGV